MDFSGNPQALSPGTFFLLRTGLVLALLVHLPFLGTVLVGSAASLILNAIGRKKEDPVDLRLSRDLIGIVAGNKAVLVLAGLVPLVPVAVIYGRILSGAAPLPPFFWLAPLTLLAAGLALLSSCRSSLQRPEDRSDASGRTGTAGIMLVFLALFLYIVGLGTLLNPEKLPLLRTSLAYILSWNALVTVALVIVLATGLTGGIILFALDRPSREANGDPARYEARVRAVGAALARPAAFLLPPLVVLNLVSLPNTALSAGVFAPAAAALLLAAAAALLPATARDGAGSPGVRVAALFAMIFFAVLAGDHAALGNAYEGRALPLQVPEAEKVAVREEPAPPEPAVAERGKAVFESSCASCHRFDARLVGPPMDEVVPKYEGDVERLKNFIRDPFRVDPDYPPMPRLGLPEDDIDAVARYLIAQAPRSGGRPGH
jgi:mono/diheme cytochrome c family protein